MPVYVYQSLSSGEIYEFKQSIHDPALTQHPQNQEPVQRVIQVPAVRIQGLKRSTTVNKLSPAATACGCASNSALAKQMYTNSRKTPVYGGLDSRKTVFGGLSKTSDKGCSHGHGQGHGGGCGHKH